MKKSPFENKYGLKMVKSVSNNPSLGKNEFLE
jgi:hypothetical protein